MNHFFSRVALGLAVFVMSIAASAAPRIDPLLQPYLSGRAPTEGATVTVIALFKDKAPLPRLEHSLQGRVQQEIALRENAKASQTATARALLGSREGASQTKLESIWLLNGMIMHVTQAQLKTLAQNDDILWLYANRTMHIVDSTPGRLTDAAGKYTYGLEKMNIPQLREKAPKIDGTGVKVGILDTGVDASHPDLTGKVIGFKDFVGTQTTPYDDHSHGTHVAGTIAGGNASGTYIGVAPGVKIIAGKVFTRSGSATMEGLLKAMQWIADPDGNPNTNDQPALVSNSWGGGAPSGQQDPMDDPFCKAIAGWVKVGILPVFAAGNSGPSAGSVGTPGACPQALTVGATDDKDAIASFSSRGPARWKSSSLIKPIVAAPGVNVVSSVPGGQWKAYSGTSMATPHVSGLAALVYQTNPNATVESVVKIISGGATHMGPPGGPNNDFGAGRVDALNTVKNTLIMLRGGQPFMSQPTGVPEL